MKQTEQCIIEDFERNIQKRRELLENEKKKFEDTVRKSKRMMVQEINELMRQRELFHEEKEVIIILLRTLVSTQLRSYTIY